MPVCRKCGNELTDENWYPSLRKDHDNICKGCFYLANKDSNYAWRQRNVERCRTNRNSWNKNHPEQKRNWQRTHGLSHNGKIVYGLNKRPYPVDKTCELCNNIAGRLVYHHWDDEKLDMGLWVCFRCHSLAELLDKFGITIVNEYFELKTKIEKEYRERRKNDCR